MYKSTRPGAPYNPAFWLGLCPRPYTVAAYSTLSEPLAGLKGPNSKRREGRGGENGQKQKGEGKGGKVRLPHSKFLDLPVPAPYTHTNEYDNFVLLVG